MEPYRSALKAAKQWIKDGCSGSEKNCLESIFPELNDDPGERTRVELLQLFSTIEAGPYQICLNAVQKDAFIAWLKRMKNRSSIYELAEDGKAYNWKPSKEQMEALQRAVNKLAQSDANDSVRLSIMYDNLKKLI